MYDLNRTHAPTDRLIGLKGWWEVWEVRWANRWNLPRDGFLETPKGSWEFQLLQLCYRARDSGTVFGVKHLVILKLSRNSRSPAPTADLFDYLWAVNWSVKRYNTFATVDSGLAHVVGNASCRETLDPLPVADLVFVGNLATGMLPLW